jgi:hypothetical protein
MLGFRKGVFYENLSTLYTFRQEENSGPKYDHAMRKSHGKSF